MLKNRKKYNKKAACGPSDLNFDNYTLHDVTHVLNVQDAMAGLLGNRIKELEVGEAELLILVSALHDLGMIYTNDDRELCFADKVKVQEYYSLHPDLQKVDVEDWDEVDRQNYLRWLHPFRVVDILKRPVWREQFGRRPNEVAPEDVIIAVCRAHGEAPGKIRREVTDSNGELRYQHTRNIDPLFCAILLRLADILDFDNSRAPSILFSYAGRSLKSVEEWKKHKASMGFTYPDEPSSDELHYGANFTDQSIERSAHVFLDWVDDELSNSRSLLPLASSRWNQFPFPFQVNRSEIERTGYDYGDFSKDELELLYNTFKTGSHTPLWLINSNDKNKSMMFGSEWVMFNDSESDSESDFD